MKILVRKRHKRGVRRWQESRTVCKEKYRLELSIINISFEENPRGKEASDKIEYFYYSICTVYKSHDSGVFYATREMVFLTS